MRLTLKQKGKFQNDPLTRENVPKKRKFKWTINFEKIVLKSTDQRPPGAYPYLETRFTGLAAAKEKVLQQKQGGHKGTKRGFSQDLDLCWISPGIFSEANFFIHKYFSVHLYYYRILEITKIP